MGGIHCRMSRVPMRVERINEYNILTMDGVYAIFCLQKRRCFQGLCYLISISCRNKEVY